MAPPRVFISYSHDSEAHAERVRGLADRLRADGIDGVIDQYEPAPPQGWPLWMEQQLEAADFVLVVSTETYLRRATGRERPGVGRGVRFESVLIVQDLYEAGMWNEKFIPVLLAGKDAEHVVRPLRPYTSYRLDSEEGYEALYRRLTGQPRVRRPELGARRTLAPRRSAAFPAPAAAGEPAASGGEEAPSTADATTGDAAAPETETADGEEPRPFWKRWTGIVTFVAIVVAILAAVLAIVSGVLDLPGKYEDFKENTGQVDEVPKQVLSGRIVDAESGEPVAGVRVQLPEHGLEASTDSSGGYRFDLAIGEDRRVELVASKAGYVTRNLDPLPGGHDTFKMRRME